MYIDNEFAQLIAKSISNDGKLSLRNVIVTVLNTAAQNNCTCN